MRAVTERYHLDYLQFSSGTNTIPSATIKLKFKNKTIESASTGDGPVDACYKAIDKATGIKGWGAEVAGPHVTVGILDVYIYGTSVCMCVCADPRVGFAEFCDGTEPSPICVNTGPGGGMPGGSGHFGCVEFNASGCGYNPCSIVPVEQRSWGSVKSLYR